MTVEHKAFQTLAFGALWGSSALLGPLALSLELCHRNPRWAAWLERLRPGADELMSWWGKRDGRRSFTHSATSCRGRSSPRLPKETPNSPSTPTASWLSEHEAFLYPDLAMWQHADLGLAILPHRQPGDRKTQRCAGLTLAAKALRLRQKSLCLRYARPQYVSFTQHSRCDQASTP